MRISKLDWQFDLVGMDTFSKGSVRVINKNKGERQKNKKVDSRNSVEESSYEHIGLSSNNSEWMNLSFQNPLTHWMTILSVCNF